MHAKLCPGVVSHPWLPWRLLPPPLGPETTSTVVWGLQPDVLELHAGLFVKMAARSKFITLGPVVTSLVAWGDGVRDCTIAHEIVERKHLWRFHLDVADSRGAAQLTEAWPR